ncbi:MAG: oxidoreductase [Melioribacteraceae bacterium]|nr:MAG: oxidoreductase [Melioribacteraceae bacterium]
MKKIDKTKPVLVTGATGYVAGALVKKLLENGITVHAAVRDPENKEKIKYLEKVANETGGTIKYFKSDLLEENSYAEAMKDCELVFHTASPFTLSIKDPQKDLVDPAVKGTRNVLETVNKADSVKRVVLTSSCAAIVGDNKDFQSYPGGVATEENWNETSWLNHQPYSFSKVMAEKEAWKINEAQDKWDLVVINPSLVIGAGINPNGTSESFNIIKQLGDGTMKMGVPDFKIGAVDVMDVAEAHFRAGFMPEAKGRYITSAENTSILNLAMALKNKYGNKYPFPNKTLPKFLVWLVAPMSGLSRKFVSNNIGYPWNTDNSKIKKELGIKFRKLDESVVEFFDQLVAAGAIKTK